MLNQFSVVNFKSYKDEATLDMQAASIKEHKEHLIRNDFDEAFLPLAVIYGPNGGGKSNILDAVKVLRNKVLLPVYLAKNWQYSTTTGSNIVTPFSFDQNSITSPTEFEIYFSTATGEYCYELSIKEEEIAFEQLSLRRKKTSNFAVSKIYTRNENEIKQGELISKLRINSEISKDLPLLSYLAIMYGENEFINDVIDWLKNKLLISDYGNPIMEVLRENNLSKKNTLEELKPRILEMFEETSLDIVDYRIERIDGKIKNIYTKHSVNGTEVELSLNEESNGTIKLFTLIPSLILSLEKGMTFIADELDAKLHPVLLKYIISLFTNPDINRNGSQLLFTSHDLATMTKEVLRRDEIWFASKGANQASALYSLVEFKNKPRNNEAYNKQYLEAKYGADPYLKKIINWGLDENGKTK